MFLARRVCQKTGFWPKLGTHDGLSAFKHALSVSSCPKTPIYIPNTHIYSKINFKMPKYRFLHPRMPKTQILAKF